MKKILVAGGAGFIGSHTLLALQAAGYAPVTYDNFSNGHRDSVLVGDVVEGDVRDRARLTATMKEHNIDAVVHFAALIEAGESVKDPQAFYNVNTGGSLALLQAMQDAGVARIVFSSTAAVYGQPADNAPLKESLLKLPINPYGHSKWMVECMLRDTAHAHGLQAIALRYFNAAGADPEGRLGERHDPETHLIPLVLQAASGARDNIKMFGTDYDTPDGTCIRDYIHVHDLAAAHVKALDKLFEMPDSAGSSKSGFYDAFNLGTGSGFSVREVVQAAKNVTGIDFNVIEEERRPGDPAYLVADATRAKSTFDWTPAYPNLEDMIEHAWQFANK
ncbi:UDP-glucose 4-epimerase GalE [Kordiimonas aquimaris]|uniref:UDP-glucose 4-epimerase GalE n=1 Tax=Kordiimonas aquimaris TaxID=707591 RepID=UPI0021CFE128|nr:UDP-glucose 4-epimerase GalE [Kordiimonas aquimaris]